MMCIPAPTKFSKYQNGWADDETIHCKLIPPDKQKG